eukprot:TRINITY_DN6671_c0_g1_i1.p1 TRINITY_DN6671_c0_g1~~TRINITY_DN6671_c0_g1_i1.p1  ORF type:complete len:345 (-),score=143.92 TRINITY_DN6671_c0_g1_i1:52-1086(-)
MLATTALEKILQKEREWLASYEIPTTTSFLIEKLRNCATILSNSGNEENIEPIVQAPVKSVFTDDLFAPISYSNKKSTDFDSNPLRSTVNPNLNTSTNSQTQKVTQSKVITFQTSQGTLKGFIRLGGWTINEAEFSVKFPKHRSFKTAISYLKPYSIVQIQNAFNFVEQARVRLQQQQMMANREQGSNIHVKSILSNYKNKLDEIYESLCNARQELVLLPKIGQRNSLLTSASAFNPSLPSDVIIEIAVKNKQLVITVNALQFKNKGSIENTIISSSPFTIVSSNSSSSIGHTLKLGNSNTLVEIVDQAEVCCNIPILDEVVLLIDQALYFTSDLREKIIALDD